MDPFEDYISRSCEGGSVKCFGAAHGIIARSPLIIEFSKWLRCSRPPDSLAGRVASLRGGRCLVMQPP